MKSDNKVIVRGEASGVFFGNIESRNGREVTLSGCRRLWYWEGAASLHQLAAEGTKIPGKCKFTIKIEEITILDAIEIIPCTPDAVKSIESVDAWKI